jgi:hypothetical protein
VPKVLRVGISVLGSIGIKVPGAGCLVLIRVQTSIVQLF